MSTRKNSMVVTLVVAGWMSLASSQAVAVDCSTLPNGADCDSDGMDCTDDVCWAGTCQHFPSADGTPCTDDGIECTRDVCTGTTCTHDPRPAGALCGDNSNTDCTNPDLCDGAGTCLTNHAPDGAPCEDGQYCTGNDGCSGGVCIGGGPACLPGEVCDEAGGVCIECFTGADCDDGNPCTSDACSSNVCIYDPFSGAPCGSSFDTECSNSDTCDGFGGCNSNDETDGTPCGPSGENVCKAGVCGSPDFATSAMPEDGAIGSDLAGRFTMEATAPGAKASLLRKVTPNFGTTFTADGVPHAAVWEDIGGPYTLTLLDKQMPIPSRAHTAVSDNQNPAIIAGHVDNQPAAWVYDGVEWQAEDPGLPPGATGGSLMDVYGLITDSNNDRLIVVGVMYDSVGRVHADTWVRDETGVWTYAMLPMLGPMAQSKANVVHFHLPMDLLVVGGAAETPQGPMRPAIWEEMTPGTLDFDDPILLPLLPGMVTGEVVALDGGQQGEEIAAGTVTAAGGNRLGAVWVCSSGYTGCSMTVLPTLPGQAHAMVTGMATFDVFFDVVGTSYTTDRLTDGEATIWRVDPSTGELLGTINANNLMTVGGLASPRVVSLADDFGPCFVGSCLTAGTVVDDLVPRGPSGPIPHIYSMVGTPSVIGPDPIPAVSEWGLIVLTLLMLCAGTVAIGRRQWSVQS